MIDVEVEDDAWTAALADVVALAINAAEAALQHAPSVAFGASSPARGGAPSSHGPPPPSGGGGSREARDGGGERHLVILLTDDESVRALNARFRGKDAATNVLSFPAAENSQSHLGDIALGYGVCAREAAEQGKALAHHLQHLVAHGVLHLLGYDHMRDDEAEEMEGLERVVLAGLGVADPYTAGERDHD